MKLRCVRQIILNVKFIQLSRTNYRIVQKHNIPIYHLPTVSFLLLGGKEEGPNVSQGSNQPKEEYSR